MINQERVELFAAALESGKYEQCTGSQRKLYPHRTTYCALGVATRVALDNGLKGLDRYLFHEDFFFSSGSLREFVAEWYGWNQLDPVLGNIEERRTISHVNDNGTSFWDIAQQVRAKWLKDNGDG